MFRDLPASRPIRSFGTGEWTGLAGASLLHVSLVLLGGSQAADLLQSRPLDTIPVVFPDTHRPPPEVADATLQPTGAVSVPGPPAFDWPDGTIPDIPLSVEPLELVLGVDPGDLFPRSAHASALANGPGTPGARGGGFVREDVLDLPLRVRRAPEPHYPERLRRAGIAGTVTIEFVLDTAGRVEESSIEVLHADRREFAEAVVRSMERARFSPGRVRGRPVRVKVRQDYRFRIGW